MVIDKRYFGKDIEEFLSSFLKEIANSSNKAVNTKIDKTR